MAGNSYSIYSTYRPQHQATANASFFNTGSLGHELKFGFGYRHIIGGSTTTWPGNQDNTYLNYNRRPGLTQRGRTWRSTRR